MKPLPSPRAKAHALPPLPPESDQTAEERDRRLIARAVQFSASIKSGLGYRSAWVSTMAEAGAAALLLERTENSNHRALVYAIDSRGYQALVMREEWLTATHARLAELGFKGDSARQLR